jgi:tetratricopeptide (TPR) repeat protein
VGYPRLVQARAGQRFGSLELISRLGRGGMGEVWLARQDGLERQVAVKILPSSHDHRSIDRLRREAQALAKIRHPHVVPVHEVGEVEGLHYYTMDLVEGRPLEAVLAGGRIPWRRAADIARQIAEALAAVHVQGVIHRDIKPANVLLAEGSDHVTLVDFGTALSEISPTLTGTGDLVGTPFYMAPEQARGEAHLADARTDVWAVGVTLYEMLTGEKPFGGDSWLAVRGAVLETEPAPPRRLCADCPRDLETIVLHCLDKAPDRRYATARALADDLAAFLANEPIRARRASLAYRLGKHVRRHRVAWLVGAVTAVVGALGLATSLIAARAAQRDREAREADELVGLAHDLAQRGEVVEAWTKLREVELRFPHAPATIGAYWAMAELARRGQSEDDVLAQEVWLDRLLEARPPAADAARAHWRLARIYDKHGFFDDAHDHYARAAESGALSPADLEDARFGLRWTEWLGQHVDAEVGGLVAGAGDLDGDGRDEVLVVEQPHSLVALRLGAGRLEVARRWDLTALLGLEVGELPLWALLTDVNGDRRPDLIAVLEDHCVAADLGEPSPRRAISLAGCHSIAAGDLDGDRRPELVAASGPPRRALRLLRVAPDWSTRETLIDDLSVDETHVTGLDIADLDGDGRPELIYAGGPWTRYDVRVARLDGDALRVVARAQLGTIRGLRAIDLDGDGRPEIVAVKSHEAPSPRLFGDDPFLGPSGPMVLKLAGDRLVRSWLDPLVPAAAPLSPLGLSTAGKTRLGPLFAVAPPWVGVLRLYYGRAGRDPIRRDLRRIGAADLVHGGSAVADLAGDGHGELVLGGARVAAYGIGPVVSSPRRERHRTGADWLSTARELREARENELALEAYRAAAAHGADPVAVAFEEGLCHAQAERWELALARFGDARQGGRADAELWRHLLEAAEATADWPIALDAARALGDAGRAAAIEKLHASRSAFLQDFAGAWRPEWRVEEPLACRGPTAAGALGLMLLPEDRALALPVDWDGSSFEASAVVALRDVQYAKGLHLELVRDDGRTIASGGVGGGGGGGELALATDLSAIDGLNSIPFGTISVDWRVFPERVALTLSYVAHVGQWQIALRDLAGKRLHSTIIRTPTRPGAGRYVLRLAGAGKPYLAASVIDLYRFELRAAPGSLRPAARAAAEPAPRCADRLDPAAAADPLHRAYALATAGRIADAARELAAWQKVAGARMHPAGFELDEHRVTEWEAGLLRFALLDEALASAVIDAGKLVPPREWGVLLRRLAYQQYVDSGQSHWRSGVIALRRATALAPDDAYGWYMLGYCWYQLRDLDAARSALERAVALDPAIERRFPKQGGPAILLARLAAQERDAAAAARWLADAARWGGNLDIARHDRALRELLGDRLRQIVGD